MVVLLVIVNDLDTPRSWGLVRPLETNPPLVVDPDTILAFAVPHYVKQNELDTETAFH
jgi:hypothetical protein